MCIVIGDGEDDDRLLFVLVETSPYQQLSQLRSLFLYWRRGRRSKIRKKDRDQQLPVWNREELLLFEDESLRVCSKVGRHVVGFDLRPEKKIDRRFQSPDNFDFVVPCDVRLHNVHFCRRIKQPSHGRCIVVNAVDFDRRIAEEKTIGEETFIHTTSNEPFGITDLLHKPIFQLFNRQPRQLLFSFGCTRQSNALVASIPQLRSLMHWALSRRVSRKQRSVIVTIA